MATDQAALLEAARRHLYPNYRQPPFVLSHGRGLHVWDLEGRRYLDLCAGIAVSTLGHGHPRLTRAIAEQAGKLIHVSNYFFNEPNLRLAEALCRLSGFERVFFCNSGTEAIEAMLKLARRHFFDRGERERHQVVAFENSFHGRTLGALAVTGQAKYRDGFGPLSGVRHAPFGDAAAVERAMTPDVAAILVEPIQGEGGVTPAPPGFIPALREIADRHGALLLADEIQSGVGRTGRFFAFEHEGVRADATALAKGLGGGVPIGALLCREMLSGALPPGSHGSTFGGNPLASAAALAVLEVLESEGLMERAARLGRHLAARLAALAETHERHVATARGVGLLQVVVLRDHVDARGLLERLREGGVLLTLAGGQGLRFSPPLVVEQADLDEGVDRLDALLKGL
ncbi:MAG TPA: acetylornithine/succinylornithine family transaminase [Polyangiaceae bacterium]|jgi:acetylornithine/N-succinyldiaminopimelate aminotransferase